MPYQTNPRSARRGAPQQIDLFAAGPQQMTGSVPAWSALPERVQAALTELMTRLLLEHVGRSQISSMTGAGHDL